MRLLTYLTLMTTLVACGLPEIFTAEVPNPLERYRYSCSPIDSLIVDRHLPALDSLYGEQLEADAYRDKILAALSFYPELRGVRIRLVRKPLRTSMAARPLRFSARRHRRTYALLVDDTQYANKPADFRRASYSAQVGCFIHELGHISYYERHSGNRIVRDGIAYVTNQRFKNEFERTADRFAIRNGGGYYVYLYRTFTFEEANLPPAYLAFKRRNYNTQEAVLEKHLSYLEAEGLLEGTECGSRGD